MKARPGASPSAAEPPLGRVLRVCGHPRRRAPDGRARLMGRLSRVGLPAASVRAGHTPCEPAENRDGFSVIFPFGATDPRLGFWWERGRVLPLPMSCSRGAHDAAGFAQHWIPPQSGPFSLVFGAVLLGTPRYPGGLGVSVCWALPAGQEGEGLTPDRLCSHVCRRWPSAGTGKHRPGVSE